MADPPTESFRPEAVAFLGSYVPRRCGIATFTHDLSDAVGRAGPDIDNWVVAMNDRPEGYRYPHRVMFEINENRPREYRLAADFLNMSRVSVCCIQHEYGIYGGDAGRHLIEFIQRLRMPVVTTMHTVLRKPDDAYREVTDALARECDQLVVLAEKGRTFLREIYDVPGEKVALIPHGIPDVPFVDPNYYKDQFGVEGRKVILTFGLLSPNKGLENMVEAMPRIVEAHDDAIYIILGATHPGILAEHGEEYRTSLKQRARELGVSDHIQFVNKFVELQELIEFLGAADVYVTPYLNEAQICSGTLAYAVGAGKAVVSTPYWHAEELLAEDRGRLVPFADPPAMADAIIDLFDNETKRHAMRKKAYNDTRPMVWDNVADQYMELFTDIAREQAQRPKPIFASQPLDEHQRPELTEIRLDHLKRLTDDVGILQHAKATVPDRNYGYCTDDVTRALIVTLLAMEHTDEPEAELDALATRYLSFIQHAWHEREDKPNGFRNFMGYDRRWLNPIGSDASQGRAIWALGVTVARAGSRGLLAPATDLFHAGLDHLEDSDHPRVWSFGLIGIHEYLRRFSGESNVRRTRERLAERLYNILHDNMDDDWLWFEPQLTWGNAHLPHALLLSGRWMFRNEMTELGLRVLDWLIEIQTDKEDGHFSPIGCHGFYPRDGERARFDQQPIEASAMIDACLEAHRLTKEKKYLKRAYRCLNWFLGDNDLHLPLYDPTTG
ncbi:MAG: glycosyltransferase family 4 protein, partial [Phycisphaeraceae bacterium]|nr:glycosyltransferase family 4 protein [Phycisphaeraceae bacterium]